MKQLIQHLSDGRTVLEEVPAPQVRDGHVLIQSCCSLVSPGTERMLLSFGKAGWIGKIRQQPERVQQVMAKMRSDGFRPTLRAVRNKLQQPISLGYSNAGRVLAVGKGVPRLKTGDRVISNGPHAEIVCVPHQLTAPIPEQVSDETAAFAVLGAIALQGIRLANPSFGETVAVIGLGLIGQLTVQLLAANGCRVIGIDPNPERCALAVQPGVTTICNAGEQNLPLQINQMTGGVGADAVLITAASNSNELIREAAEMSRKRGRIILTGVTGLQLNRSDFYEKELSFQVSCSYGPGRYDYQYEQQGIDYPVAFVRWTEQRNFEAVLQAMADGKLRTAHLLQQTAPLEQYKEIYDALAVSAVLASLIRYDTTRQHRPYLQLSGAPAPAAKGSMALIGAGNFSAAVLVPALRAAGADIRSIFSEQGLSAALLAKRFDIPAAGTDTSRIWSDTDTDTVVIATRHNTHAALCLSALSAGKHIFVEKPLALNKADLDLIAAAQQQSRSVLHVGFNRRFAPLSLRMQALIGPVHTALNIIITVNAGLITGNSWLNDPAVSGGRLVSEACHFIDLCSFLCASDVTAVCAQATGTDTEQASILLRYANGSNATIHYFTNGHKAYDKERVEVYQDGRVLILENWKKLSGYGFSQFSSAKGTQDKGHQEQVRRFLQCLRSGAAPPIPFSSLYNTSLATLSIGESLQQQAWITI